MSTYQLIGITYASVGLLGIFALIWESQSKATFKLADLPLTHIATWVIRILVGSLFIYSGFIKANDYTGFAYKLEEYFVVFGTEFMVPLSFPLAWFISVFEIALGAALILGFLMQVTMWLSMLMMIFFTILTGYSHFTGAVTDCGCFGDALKIAPWESFTKDIILTIMLIPLFVFRKQIPPIPNAQIAGWSTLFVFALSGGFASYCKAYLPLIDYRPYKEGVNLERCTTEFGPEGMPLCKDWYFFEEKVDVFSGNVLMIIMHNLNEAPQKALEESITLAKNLPQDVKVLGATATSKATVEELNKELGFSYPFDYMDQTVLKTIVRSNPGYMLLKEGVIIKKWHYNNTPTQQEITNLLTQ